MKHSNHLVTDARLRNALAWALLSERAYSRKHPFAKRDLATRCSAMRYSIQLAQGALMGVRYG